LFDFFLQTKTHNGDPCIQVTGSCREYSLDQFNAAIKEAASKAAKAVYLDLSLTKLLDSASLGTIVSHFNLLRGQGKRLVLLNPSVSCRHLLEITSLTRVLEIEEDSASTVA
jgi:anti-anti-sigma factor